MLEIRDLTKVYDNTVRAVNKLNLTVNPGEIFVMLGANGAGKTSLLNAAFPCAICETGPKLSAITRMIDWRARMAASGFICA